MIKGYVIVDVSVRSAKPFYYSYTIQNGVVMESFSSDENHAYIFFTIKQAKAHMKSRHFKPFLNKNFGNKFEIWGVT